MRFWDSSAIVPLLVPERASPSLQRLYHADPVMFAWWAAEIECASAIVRRQRTGALAAAVVEGGHDLWAADALQLAAALFAAEARPSTLEFVCLDDRLLAAARREGFPTPGNASVLDRHAPAWLQFWPCRGGRHSRSSSMCWPSTTWRRSRVSTTR